MGQGESHPAQVALVDTGCLVESHSSQYGKYACGGAALALKGDVLYVAGGKGLGVFDVKNVTSGGAGGENGKVPRIGSVIDTGAMDHHGGAAMAFFMSNTHDLMYLAGGKGLVVFDVSTPQSPKKLGDVIDTGALSCHGGASLALDGDVLYVAGGNGLSIFSLKADPVNPQKVGETINTGALAINAGATLKIIQRPGCRVLYVCGGKGLAVFDLQNPANPVQCGDVVKTKCFSSVGCTGIADSGSEEIIFVAGGKGLGVLDVRHPKMPNLVKKVDTGVLAREGGSAMVTDVSDKLYGATNTLLIAGGKGLGVFTLPPAQDLLSRAEPKRMGMIDTGAMSYDSDTAILLDDASRLLYVAGGKGLAVFDLSKFEGASTQLAEVTGNDANDDSS